MKNDYTTFRIIINQLEKGMISEILLSQITEIKTTE